MDLEDKRCSDSVTRDAVVKQSCLKRLQNSLKYCQESALICAVASIRSISSLVSGAPPFSFLSSFLSSSAKVLNSSG